VASPRSAACFIAPSTTFSSPAIESGAQRLGWWFGWWFVTSFVGGVGAQSPFAPQQLAAPAAASRICCALESSSTAACSRARCGGAEPADSGRQQGEQPIQKPPHCVSLLQQQHGIGPSVSPVAMAYLA
jgi:hypothetical protein